MSVTLPTNTPGLTHWVFATSKRALSAAYDGASRPVMDAGHYWYAFNSMPSDHLVALRLKKTFPNIKPDEIFKIVQMHPASSVKSSSPVLVEALQNLHTPGLNVSEGWVRMITVAILAASNRKGNFKIAEMDLLMGILFSKSDAVIFSLKSLDLSADTVMQRLGINVPKAVRQYLDT